MMPSSGPPTPKGVGGPTPPLVSRGSEEEWKMKIPTGGPPTLAGGGVQYLPPHSLLPDVFCKVDFQYTTGMSNKTCFA